ncbi:hypothetical protein MTR_4g086090 [Medicago truncatula]|uniref:Uncharacterized protein n=1 Tax=Medicago truncatula TaxID=3880 RepID=G7JL82_MEDTR|nr:hypothetical protein MTR_4g086090 [Medicago truncatula]
MASNISRFSQCDIDLNVEFTPLPDLNFDAEEIFSHEEAEEFNNDIGIQHISNNNVHTSSTLITLTNPTNNNYNNSLNNNYNNKVQQLTQQLTQQQLQQQGSTTTRFNNNYSIKVPN